jgi:hypothetical protein
MALKNYADVQAALNNFVNVAGVTPGQAPHGAFWNSMDYTEFTTGNIPGVPAGPWKILVVGNSQNSNIIQILSGVGDAFNDFGQMPQPNPPYVPPAGTEQATLIAELSAWIDAGCPNDTANKTEAEQSDLQGKADSPAAPIKEFHVCMGLNSCAHHDVTGTALMAGAGNCATVKHYCHTLNNCRGQGFCGGGGSSGAQQTEPGNNVCSALGSCSTLAGPGSTVGPQWYMNQGTPANPRQGPLVPPPGPYYGQKVWHVARQLFETRMYEQGRTFVADGKTIPPGLHAKNCFGPSPQPDGPNPPPPDQPTEL